MSVSIILVGKTGEIKETEIKTFDAETLYKKAGYKVADGFAKQTEWGIEIEDAKYNIVLYAKTTGRAGQENKYEFPPPVDTTLFFGTCVLVNVVDGSPVDLFQEEWSKIYEALYGGFEDLENADDEADEDSEDDSDDAEIPKTKEGYAKDGFIVDDDESDDVDDSDDVDESEDEINDSSEDEIIIAKSKGKATKANVNATKANVNATKANATKANATKANATKAAAVATKAKANANETKLENIVLSKKPATRLATRSSKKATKVEQESSYLNCENELELEEYV
jgi:hypothetical protein